MIIPTLVVTVLVAVLIPMASAETETETDPAILHKLATEAQIHVEEQIQESDAPQVWNLLNNGTAHVNFILNATTVEESSDHFLAAMEAFRQAVEIMGKDTPIEDISDYSERLERDARYFEQLLYLVDAYDMSIDVAELEGLFSTARAMLQDNDGDVEEVLDSIALGIESLREEITVVATEKEQERAIQYAQEYLIQLDRFLEVADDSDIPDDVIEEIQALRSKLEEATQSDVIVSIILEIISIKEGLSLDTVDQLQLWGLQLEDTVRQFWIDDKIDDAEYTSALVTLEKCRFFLDIEEIDEAETLLDELNNWLVDIEG
ncbi:MAG: hypothetical protein F4Y18_06170 [Cenarchaeum sp. SB0663_bin_5]|nr:hypothetical protein [Cenarchaeum sp. SB0663_bin_5]MYH03643.1 hypothetical protein [Cenarchaeum sp. SB0675_bin_21]MYL12111.1 hypothetical protein [Cenarchaeum sp. SB0669_bin_11]